jgi:hypothetical protein
VNTVPEQRAVLLTEAARCLGATPAALRVRRGTLVGHERSGLWYVLLPDDHELLRLPARSGEPTVRHAPAQGEQRADEPTAQRAPARGEHADHQVHADLVARLDAEVAFLRAALAQEQLATAELRRLLAAEQQRRLLAPVETVATQPQAAENPARATDPAPTSAGSWWRFWRR